MCSNSRGPHSKPLWEQSMPRCRVCLTLDTRGTMQFPFWNVGPVLNDIWGGFPNLFTCVLLIWRRHSTTSLRVSWGGALGVWDGQHVATIPVQCSQSSQSVLLRRAQIVSCQLQSTSIRALYSDGKTEIMDTSSKFSLKGGWILP